MHPDAQRSPGRQRDHLYGATGGGYQISDWRHGSSAPDECRLWTGQSALARLVAESVADEPRRFDLLVFSLAFMVHVSCYLPLDAGWRSNLTR
jgi:hypothetical protein